MKKTISFAVAMSLICTLAVQAQDYTPTPLDESTFDAYAAGWECARVPKWNESRFWRDKRPDTIYTARAGNPDQRSTVEKARKCVQRFNLSNTASRDVVGLLQAFLAAENDSQADATAAKLVSTLSTTPVQARAWGLYHIVNSYLSAAQPKIQKAEKHIAMLEALGAPAAFERMIAHARLAAVAQRRDSVQLWGRELAAAIVASKQMAPAPAKQYAYESARVYKSMAFFKMRINDPQAAIQTIETARSVLIPIRASVARILIGAEAVYARIGQPASPIQATKWFFTPTANSIYPASGRVTLAFAVSHNCGQYCYGAYAILKRLSSKFSAQGLDVVMMARTGGYFRGQLVKPDSEIVSAGDYFKNIALTPLPLAIWRTDYGRRDDGKLMVLSSPNDENYSSSNATVVGPDGKIRIIMPLLDDYEAIYEDIIAELLSK